MWNKILLNILLKLAKLNDCLNSVCNNKTILLIIVL